MASRKGKHTLSKHGLNVLRVVIKYIGGALKDEFVVRQIQLWEERSHLKTEVRVTLFNHIPRKCTPRVKSVLLMKGVGRRRS